MRKTVTFSDFVLDVAAKAGQEPSIAQAIRQLSGRPVGSSESARIDQLASIGAARVLATSVESGYQRLAELVAGDTVPAIQKTLGSPIVGEDDDSLETLRVALAELEQ